jgi:hypothetical protein
VTPAECRRCCFWYRRSNPAGARHLARLAAPVTQAVNLAPRSIYISALGTAPRPAALPRRVPSPSASLPAAARLARSPRGAFRFVAGLSVPNSRPPRSPSFSRDRSHVLRCVKARGAVSVASLHPAPHPALESLTQLRPRLLLIAGRRTQGNGGNGERHRQLSRNNFLRRDSESRGPAAHKTGMKDHADDRNVHHA